MKIATSAKITKNLQYSGSIYHKPLAICSFNKVTSKILLAESLSYLYFKVASQILWCIFDEHQVHYRTKCQNLPYESLAWASKSNITGRNCFRMHSFILICFFFSIQFSFNTENSFTNITIVKCARYCINPRYVSCQSQNNLHQRKKNKTTKTKYHLTSELVLFCGHQLFLSPPPIIYLSLDLLQSICNNAHRRYSLQVKECAVKSPLSSYRSY